MPHRDVSIALCGAVVGVILGAASVSYIQRESLAARVAIPIRPQGIDVERRSARDVNTRASAIKEEQRQRSENRHEVPAKGETAPVEQSTDSTACSLVTAVINDLVTRTLAIVPETPVTNTERRIKIRAAGNAIIAVHCAPAHEAAPSDQSAAAKERTAQLEECLRRYPKGEGDRKYERCVRFNNFAE